MSLSGETEFYDGFAAEWDGQFTNLAGKNLRFRKLGFIRRCLRDVRGVCLDVGCATGFFTSRTGRSDLRVVGVDVSRGMVEYSSRKFPDLEFVVCSAETLSQKFRGVDGVFMIGVYTAEGSDVLLRECWEALRVGGKLIISTGNARNPYLRFLYDRFYPDLPARVSLVEELEEKLREHGFKVCSRRVYHMIPMNVPDWLFGFVKRVEGLLDRTFLVRWFGSIVAVEAVKI